MSLKQQIKSFTWTRYSQKLKQKIDQPRNIGTFSPRDVEGRDLRLAFASEGEIKDGNRVTLYCLVSLEDGVIMDAKFQVFGHSALIGAADTACDLLVGKNYEQARRMGANLLDMQLQDKSGESAFPDETYTHINLLIDVIDQMASRCTDIPVSEETLISPIPSDIEGKPYPGWETLSKKQKLAVIEEVVAQDIRPYIELDQGGVEIINLINEREVIIAYQGACTSCFSATGATLSYIQQTLQAKVFPDLVVIPDMENF